MAKETTTKERLTAIETTMTLTLKTNEEARQDEKEWRKEVREKMDKLLNDNRTHVTSSAVAEAIALHAKECSARNPGNSLPSARELTKQYWQLIVSLVGIIGTLGGALVFVLSRIA